MFNLVMAYSVLVMLYVFIFVGIGYIIYELASSAIKDRKEKEQEEIKYNRRHQLIKELRNGIFNLDEAKKKQEELGELMRDQYWVRYNSTITQQPGTGIWKLTKLVTDGYNWI